MDKKLLSIASRVRKQIIKDTENYTLTGECYDASLALKKAFDKAGIKSSLIQGTFQLDDPDPSEIENVGEDVAANPLHYWVKVRNTIVDITVSQFNDELDGETFPDIFIGMHPRYQSLKKINIVR